MAEGEGKSFKSSCKGARLNVCAHSYIDYTSLHTAIGPLYVVNTQSEGEASCVPCSLQPQAFRWA